jgi:hypothetical protein
LSKTRKKFNKKGLVKTVNISISDHKKNVIFTQIYENSNFAIALCSEIKGDRAELLCPPTTCRETLANRVISILNEKKPYDGNNKVELPKRKTCVLVSVNSGGAGVDKKVNMPELGRLRLSYKDWTLRSCQSALNLLNHFEKRNGWLQTKLYKVEYNLTQKNFIMYYFTGSKWWLHAPQTFSLFNLLIKLGRQENIQALRKNSNHESIIKAIKAVTSLSHHVKNAHKWAVLIDNRKVIYKDRKLIASNWNNNITCFDGISKLTSGASGDKTVQDRFNAVLKTH